MFDESKLQELAESIRTNALIQPIPCARIQTAFRSSLGQDESAPQLAEVFSLPARIVEIDDA